jgi:hypothetical protein
VIAGLAVFAGGVLLRPGAAWEVIGDTTTTMMWVEGVSPWDLAWAVGSLLLGSLLVVLGWRRALRRDRPA